MKRNQQRGGEDCEGEDGQNLQVEGVQGAPELLVSQLMKNGKEQKKEKKSEAVGWSTDNRENGAEMAQARVQRDGRDGANGASIRKELTVCGRGYRGRGEP